MPERGKNHHESRKSKPAERKRKDENHDKKHRRCPCVLRRGVSDRLVYNRKHRTGRERKYIMRDYNGRIAVFVYGEDEPQEVFDVFTSSLPRDEAERVYKGITVEGEEALQKLIEDFTG